VPQPDGKLRSAADFHQSRLIALHFGVFRKPAPHFSHHFGCSLVGRIDEAIMHPFAVAPRFDYSGPPQKREMARNLGLTRSQSLNQKADAYLAFAHQVDQTKPRAVGKRAE
jgi:hypothetical protein